MRISPSGILNIGFILMGISILLGITAILGLVVLYFDVRMV